MTLFPCNECAKAIIQAGIKEVIYLSDKYHGSNSMIASRKMFEMAKIKVKKYEGRVLDIELKENGYEI